MPRSSALQVSCKSRLRLLLSSQPYVRDQIQEDFFSPDHFFALRDCPLEYEVIPARGLAGGAWGFRSPDGIEFRRGMPGSGASDIWQATEIYGKPSHLMAERCVSLDGGGRASCTPH